MWPVRQIYFITVGLVLTFIAHSKDVESKNTSSRLRGFHNDDDNDVGMYRQDKEPANRRRHLQVQEECTLTLQDVEYYAEASLPESSSNIFSQRPGRDSGREGASRNLSPATKSASKWCCELQGTDATAAGMDFVYVDGLSEDFYKREKVESGESLLIADAAIDLDKGEMVVHSESAAKVEKKSKKEGKGDKKGKKDKAKRRNQRRLNDAVDTTNVDDDTDSRRKLAVTTGEKRVLVVRMKGSDSETTSSETQLRNDVFDSGISLATQYAACSHDKLKMVPASGYNNGVTTLTLSSLPINGKSNDSVRNAAIAALGGSRPNNVDLVMLCIPPGTLGNWIAYAYVNSWLSVYNDEWCRTVSGQVHEIGHNLNLDHSSEGNQEYGDQSGMMGFSYFDFNAPEMCFNPAKTWQLGWFDDTDETVTFNSDSGSTYTLVGASRSNPQQGKYVVIKVPNGSTDLYIGYNRKSGSNSGTVEDGNKVLIVSRPTGTGYAKSTKLKALASTGGEDETTYVIGSYLGNSRDLAIKFSSTVSSGGDAIAEAVVDIYLEGDAPPTPAPTPACGGSGAFELSLLTDQYPQETTWTLRLGSNVIASGPNGGNYPASTTTKIQLCLSPGEYTFTLNDSYGDGICCGYGDGSYSATLDGIQIFSSNGIFDSSESKVFTVGSVNNPTAPPTSPPTQTPTSPPTQSPTNPPTPVPTASPTNSPTPIPTASPTNSPTPIPTASPTSSPTPIPTASPTNSPTPAPTASPTNMPTLVPTKVPTGAPTTAPPTFPGPTPTNPPTTLPPTAAPTTLPPTPLPTTLPPTPVPTPQPTPNSGGGCNGDPNLVEFVMEITTDQYPGETRWQLFEWTRGSRSVSVIVAQNPQSGYTIPNNSYAGESTCIINSSSSGERCYALRVQDTYGDGMCCTYGNGSYKVSIGDEGNAVELINGGQFGFYEWRTFCLS